MGPCEAVWVCKEGAIKVQPEPLADRKVIKEISRVARENGGGKGREGTGVAKVERGGREGRR